MLGSIRLLRVTLPSLMLGTGLALISQFGSVVAAGSSASTTADDVARKDGPAAKSETPAGTPGYFAQPGEDRASPFVPLRPLTVDDRRQTEAVRLYIAARALDERVRRPHVARETVPTPREHDVGGSPSERTRR